MMLAIVRADPEDAGRVVDALRTYCVVNGYKQINNHELHVTLGCRIKLRDMQCLIMQALLKHA